jgi:hypothetical protein
MRKLGMISAVALLITAGNAFAITADLSVGGNHGIINVDPGLGGSFDVRLDLVRGGDTNSIGNAQTNFVADLAGITIVGTVGTTFMSGTGTRYNELEWDASTTGSAQNPNTTLAGAMSPGVPRGLFGTLYNGSWQVGDSFFGILRVNVAAGTPGTDIHLNPTGGIVGDDQTFEDLTLANDGVTFHYTPEPASALLLLGALPFMRRRRTA